MAVAPLDSTVTLPPGILVKVTIGAGMTELRLLVVKIDLVMGIVTVSVRFVNRVVVVLALRVRVVSEMLVAGAVIMSLELIRYQTWLR